MWKSPQCLGAVRLRQFLIGGINRMVVALKRKGEPAIIVRAVRVIFQRESVTRPIILQRCRSELPWKERRDERAARFVPRRDHAHRQPPAFALEIKVHPKRPNRPPRPTRLIRVEEPKEQPRSRLR